MSPKALLIVLILVALIVGVAITRGHYRDRNDRPVRPDSAPGKGFKPLDNLLGRFRDSLDISRMTGCGRTGRALSINGYCDASIAAGRSKNSSFTLKPLGAEVVQACYAFNQRQFDDCTGNEEKRGRLDSGGSRFVVGKDKAFLRLYCHPAGNGPCVVSVE
jgi:hypothetical protein